MYVIFCVCYRVCSRGQKELETDSRTKRVETNPFKLEVQAQKDNMATCLLKCKLQQPESCRRDLPSSTENVLLPKAAASAATAEKGYEVESSRICRSIGGCTGCTEEEEGEEEARWRRRIAPCCLNHYLSRSSGVGFQCSCMLLVVEEKEAGRGDKNNQIVPIGV